MNNPVMPAEGMRWHPPPLPILPRQLLMLWRAAARLGALSNAHWNHTPLHQHPCLSECSESYLKSSSQDTSFWLDRNLLIYIAATVTLICSIRSDHRNPTHIDHDHGPSYLIWPNRSICASHKVLNLRVLWYFGIHGTCRSRGNCWKSERIFEHCTKLIRDQTFQK